jgi:hypothetical protein
MAKLGPNEREEHGIVTKIGRKWATVRTERGGLVAIPKGLHRVGDPVALIAWQPGYAVFYSEKTS